MSEPNRKQVRILSRTQEKVVSKLRGNSVKVAAQQLNMTPDAIYMNNTRVYQKFIGLLDIMVADYSIFGRRFRANKTVYTQLRKLARLAKGEVKSKNQESNY